MPSAASVKFDRQFNPENALADPSQNLTPLRQAITIIEHKIRNLEKRKSKLESYRELQNAGKELNADQKTAVAKFNEVISTLEFARDLNKQFLSIAAGSEKEAKKLAKKEAALKYQCELARLREILLVQDALNQMGNENVRDDFLHGRHGAANLTETDLKLLDDFYPAVTPKHEAGNPLTFTNEVQAAAEHLLAAVDGKPKEVFGGSYSQVKEILGKIHESGYFDRVHYEVESYVEAGVIGEVVEPVADTVLDQDVSGSSSLPPQLQDQIMPPTVVQQPPVNVTPLPPIESLSIEPRLPPPASVVPQPDLGGGGPTGPPTMEPQVLPPEQQVYYQHQQMAVHAAAPPQQQQQPQPPRPITEMLSTGSFFFLQESEIDPLPEQIPTQTFTNQSFTPHPVQVQQQPPPQHFVSMQPPPPNNLQPHSTTSHHHQHHQVPQMAAAVIDNGIENNLIAPEEPPMPQPPHHQLKENNANVGGVGTAAGGGGGGLNRGPRPANNSQSYYQNHNHSNNNYNRSRQNNQSRNANGPRPVSTRH